MEQNFEREMIALGRDLQAFVRRGDCALALGTVKSINKDDNTTSVSIGSKVVIADVSLNALGGGTANALFYPKVDSTVVVGYADDSQSNAFVVAYTDLDQIFIQYDRENATDSITLTPNEVIITRNNDNTISVAKDKISIATKNCSLDMDSSQVSINNHLVVKQ